MSWRPDGNSRGYALMSVTMIGLVIMLAAAALANNGVTTEARAVEEDLLRLRAYWAAMGHATYTLSRGRQGGLCGGLLCSNDAARANSYKGYYNELNDSGADLVTLLPNHRRWIYDGIGTDYYLNIAGKTQKSQSSGSIDLGALEMTAQFHDEETTSLPLIARVWPQFQDRVLEFCVGLSSPQDACSAVALATTNVSGVARISAMRPK